MADAITIKALQDASLDAKSLEEVVNGNESKQVTTRKGETYPSVKKAIKTLFENGGLPATPFATKALMTASALVDGDYAMVTNEDGVKKKDNGLYYKESGAWIKSPFDPVELAKTYTDAVSSTLSSSIEKSLTTDPVSLNLFEVKDSLGTTTLYQDDLGDLHDLSSNISETSRFLSKNNASDNIFEVLDSGGLVSFKQNKDGHIFDTKVGDVSQAIINLQNKSTEGNSQSSPPVGKYADYNFASGMNENDITEVLLRNTDVNAAAILSHPTDIIRVPSITRISKNEFITFIECRNDDSDFGLISLVAVKFSVDPTSYLPTIVSYKAVHESYLDELGRRISFLNSAGVKLDDESIIIMYAQQRALGENSTADSKLIMKRSTDNGDTWGAPIDISYVKDQAGINGFFPNSQGIIKRYGKNKGRIVFPVWSSGATYEWSEFQAGFIYSDDNGETWELGELADYYRGNECQIAEDLNGDMIFCIRTRTPAEPKIYSRYSEVTNTYTKIEQDRVLSEAQVMSGFARAENKYDYSVHKFVMATPITHIDRRGMSIHTTYDACHTWISYEVPFYSGISTGNLCLEFIDEKHILVVSESSGNTGLFYAVVPLNNLIGK